MSPLQILFFGGWDSHSPKKGTAFTPSLQVGLEIVPAAYKFEPAIPIEIATHRLSTVQNWRLLRKRESLLFICKDF